MGDYGLAIENPGYQLVSSQLVSDWVGYGDTKFCTCIIIQLNMASNRKRTEFFKATEDYA